MSQAVLAPRKRRFNRRKAKRGLFIFLMLLLPIAQFLVFFVYANIDSVLLAFQKINYASETVEWTLDNFRRFFSELVTFDRIRNALLNSLLVGVNDALLVTISAILAYFFYKKIPGHKIFRVIFFLPSIISIVIYTMAYRYMFDENAGGLIPNLLMAMGVANESIPTFLNDNIWGRVLILFYCTWVGTGYNILVLGNAMSNVPSDTMEYAHLEGCPMWREIFQLMIPMIWPTISVAYLGSVTAMFTLFLQVQLITGGGPDGSTQTIAFMTNDLITNGYLERGAAFGLCFTLIAIPAILLIKFLLDRTSKKLGF